MNNKKEKRINNIVKNIESTFYNGQKNSNVSYTRTMKVGIDVNQISAEMKEKLDKLMNNSDFKRREVLTSLMEIFYSNPTELINKAGKIKEKINKKTGEITSEYKFSSQQLYGKLYTEFAKSKQIENYSSKIFYESVLSNVAKEVCSFLDKYYKIRDEINKTIKENNEKIKQITINLNELLQHVENKNENDKYNTIIKQNNILINLYNQQHYKSEDKLPLLTILKGFPSFPLVEKIQDVNYSELNELFYPYVENAILFWDTINKEQMQNAMEHFYGRNIYKWFEHYYNLKVEKPNEKNEYKYELLNFSQAKTDKSAICTILERIDKKINNIKTDTEQGKKQKTEWLRSKSLIIFEYLRQRNDNTEFANIRGKFDLLSSVNNGFISKNTCERKVFEITGINEGHKSAILEKIVSGKTKYSFAFNIFKNGSTFKVNDNGKCSGLMTFGGSKKKPNEGEVNKGKYTRLVNITFNTDTTFDLPLKFGKRYAREYLYNNTINFENNGITLNNARIIKEDKKYYLAITFTKLKGNVFDKNSNIVEPEHIIGVDRGEKLPVAIAITDMDGKLVEYPKIDICEQFAKKQNEIDKQKREQSSQTGKYDDNLKKKAKNFSKAAIEKIGIELLFYATKYKGLIVLENLSREFGIDPIMAKRQYSKIEDFLSRKLKENGLMPPFNNSILENTNSGLLAKVIAQHTSKTCSHCGCVFAFDKLCNLEISLGEDDIYYVELDGKKISLDIDYETYSKTIGHKIILNANKQIKELIIKDTKENKEKIKRIIVKALNPRKTQENFKCPVCGHEQNADEQAGLNIARRWVFVKSKEYMEYKRLKDTKNKISYWKAWENFCKNNVEKWNQKN